MPNPQLREALADQQSGPAQGAEDYGQSGSILVLNPTSRRTKVATGLSAASLRDETTIRGWASTAQPPIVPGVPTISNVLTHNGTDIDVFGSNYSTNSRIWIKTGTGAGEFVQQATTFRSTTELYTPFPQNSTVTYQVKVVDGSKESNVYSFVASG